MFGDQPEADEPTRATSRVGSSTTPSVASISATRTSRRRSRWK